MATQTNNIRTVGVGLSIVAGAMLFGALVHAVGQGQMAFAGRDAAGNSASLVQTEPRRADGDLDLFVVVYPDRDTLGG